MSIVIDRSKTNTDKSADVKKRFIKRNRAKIKEAVKEKFNRGKMDSMDSTGIDVQIDGSTTEEYSFVQDPSTGVSKRVYPGNAGTYSGDGFSKPRKQSGGSGKGSAGNGEDAEDDYIFHLNEKEFQELLFEYLELPDFIKKSLKDSKAFKLERAGNKTNGNPSQLSLIKSYLNSYARRLILETELDEELKLSTSHAEQVAILEEKENIPFFEEEDLRYKNWEKHIHKINHAVMFCIMDVSGSMDESLKQRAKKFFYLLYIFLKYKYTNFEVRFIAHTTEAYEVSEADFFYGRRSGGTTILPAYELMKDIIDKEYDVSTTNLYLAQASDGDCFGDDITESPAYLAEEIVPLIQYGAYLEVIDNHFNSAAKGSDFMKELKKVIQDPKFQTRTALYDKEVFDIFIDLFKRNKA